MRHQGCAGAFSDYIDVLCGFKPGLSLPGLVLVISPGDTGQNTLTYVSTPRINMSIKP